MIRKINFTSKNQSECVHTQYITQSDFRLFFILIFIFFYSNLFILFFFDHKYTINIYPIFIDSSTLNITPSILILNFTSVMSIKCHIVIFNYNSIYILFDMQKFIPVNITGTSYINNFLNNCNISNHDLTKKIQHYIFKLSDCIGNGNFSRVYKGLNQNTGEVVAIKVVELNQIKTPALVQLLYSQIQILKHLKHPNILNCFQVFTSVNNCYIITQYCNEGNLESKIRQKGAIPEKQISKIILDIYRGLKYLAEQGIIHRDLKIANILFDNGVAKIADFGFAKKTRDKFKDISIGSPIYMSPEGIIDNIYGPKTDVWAFGIMIYQLLNGDTPLGFCKTEEQLKVHIFNPIIKQKLNQCLSLDIKQLILRCLQIDQRKRISMLEIQNTNYFKRIIQQQYYNDQNNSRISKSSSQMYSIIQTQTGMLNLHHPNNLTIKLPYQKLLYENPTKQYLQTPQLSPNNKLNIFSVSNNDENRKRNLSCHDYNTNLSINNMKKVSSAVKLQQLQLNQFVSSSRNDSQKTDDKKNIKILQPYAFISYQQCVYLLHYCRLVYKNLILLIQNQKIVNTKIINIFTSWLFDTFNEIQSIVPTKVKFQGDKAALRQKKMKDVLNQYSKKYHSELYIKQYIPTNFKMLQEIISQILRNISQQLNTRYLPQKKQYIVISHYLCFLYETNMIILRCVQLNDYTSYMKNCNIEAFLAFKKQNYNQHTYENLKAKIKKIIYKQ